MAYIKQDWKDFPNETTPITAERMNHIEDGIYNTLNEIINIMCPVGTYYETSDLNFDPNVMWGGTWELENDGTVLVSKSSVSSSKFNVDLGTVVGEENHTLTVDEMPSHAHNNKMYTMNAIDNNYGFARGGSYTDRAVGRADTSQYNVLNSVKNIQNTGGSVAHNNVQPSKVVNRWHRTA